MTIELNIDPLKSVTTLPYLGHTIEFNNRDWVNLYQNLRKSQRC